MIDTPDAEYLIRPEDIIVEISLKRHKDYDYFLMFGIGSLASFILFLLHIMSILFFFVLVVCLPLTIVFGIITLSWGDIGKLYRKMDKILVTRAGIALRDYQGRAKFFMPFSGVTGIRYGYREHVVSAVLDLGARVPTFVQFDLSDGTKFTIPMNYIAKGEEKKIFPHLPVFR